MKQKTRRKKKFLKPKVLKKVHVVQQNAALLKPTGAPSSSERPFDCECLCETGINRAMQTPRSLKVPSEKEQNNSSASKHNESKSKKKG